jgi:hypothetical protein
MSGPRKGIAGQSHEETNARFHDKLRKMGLSARTLKARHGLTFHARTRVTQEVRHNGHPIGYVAPTAGGFNGYIKDEDSGQTHRHHKHNCGPFSSKEMAAAAVAHSKGLLNQTGGPLPQKKAQMNAPGMFDGDELAGVKPLSQG